MHSVIPVTIFSTVGVHTSNINHVCWAFISIFLFWTTSLCLCPRLGRLRESKGFQPHPDNSQVSYKHSKPRHNFALISQNHNSAVIVSASRTSDCAAMANEVSMCIPRLTFFLVLGSCSADHSIVSWPVPLLYLRT